MSTAYIDTSVLIPIETCQPDSDVYEKELGRFERLVSKYSTHDLMTNVRSENSQEIQNK